MRLNIAIDGPVGAGKSSIADAVAARLGILHLDTGAMYRALGLSALRRGIDPKREDAVTALCRALEISVQYTENGQRTLVDGEDVTGLIRTQEVSMAASAVSTHASVRKHMVSLQQALAARTDMVLDGRDICTTVLPDAPVKIFLTADPRERARRRWLEMREKGGQETLEQVYSELRRRDHQDMTRSVEPLRQAPDAVLVDTTGLNFDQSVEAVLKVVEEKYHG